MLHPPRRCVASFAHLSAMFLIAMAMVATVSIPRAHAQGSTVLLVPNPDWGMVLTDSSGWSLYTWDGDGEGVSNCYDACAEAWPPFTVDGDLVAPSGLTGTLGWIDRGEIDAENVKGGGARFHFTLLAAKNG